MLERRQAQDRGHAEHGWLNSYHSFSFADYYDPQQMGWGSLRVINDDTVQPSQGFGKHGHRDMEIISYVLEGALAHQDSMGNGSVLRPGQVQIMHAGTGVMHSEFNHSDKEAVHFLQIWVIPKFSGSKPGYDEATFSAEEKQGKLRLLVSPAGENGSLTIGQDMKLYGALLDGNDKIIYKLPKTHHAYLHVARGEVSLNGEKMFTGDGMKILDEDQLILSDANKAEILLFDLY